MPLESPVIDNRRFEDIVQEARTLIPRYAPEWTDLNDNDPGMALVQLFAWMTDMLLYRLAQVPDLHYVKFLQLLGIELRPAEPAHAEVTFPLVDDPGQQTIIVPSRTQVAAAVAVGDEPIIFETDQSLIALAARLNRVLVYDGYEYADITKQNSDAVTPFLAFGDSAAEGSALLFGFGYPSNYSGSKNDFPKTQLNLAFSIHTDDVASLACRLTEAQVFPSAQLYWEYWHKPEWRPLSIDKDTTVALTRSGHVLLRTPEVGELTPDNTFGDPSEQLFWIRVRVVKAGYERVPQLDAMRTNTVGVTQAQTQNDEVVGGSNGTPNQTLQLAFRPVLKDTLHLELDEGSGFEPWTEVEDFYASISKNKHFILNRTAGEIRFGDGERGQIPVANPDNPDANVVAREYRYGGGKKGNVAAAKLNNLSGSVPGVDTNAITNLRPAVGGRDEESLADAKLRGPEELKNKDRAVTEEDFEHLAKEAPGVKRTKAVSLAHPGFPNVKVPGAVTIIIVPDSDMPKPVPSEGMIRTVCAYLNDRRLLTTELYVVPPVYHKVSVQVDVIAEGNADLAEVKNDVEQALLAYFHPLTGGEDGDGWEFGGNIFFSLVYRHVFDVPGVLRVQQAIIQLDDVDQPLFQDVSIEPGALVYSESHDVTCTYETAE